MSKMMRLGGHLAAAFAVATALLLTAPVAFADGACGVTPGHTQVIHHPAVTHAETQTVSGQPEKGFDTFRWSRTVPAVKKSSHAEYQFNRVDPGQAEVSHKEAQFSRVVPGTAEVSHLEYRFSRQNPGQEAVSHSEYRFSRTNPGTPEVSHLEYRFARENPGQPEVSHQEYRYAQDATGYRYRVRTVLHGSRVVESVQGWSFVDGGTTTVNGVVFPGHWQQLPEQKAEDFSSVPDAIVNAAWAPEGPPADHFGSGSISLATYGGDDVNVAYTSEKVDTDEGYSEWSSWSEWSMTDAGESNDTREVQSAPHVFAYKGGAWTTDTPGEPWQKVDERKVVDKPAVEAFTEYKTAQGISKDAKDAAWFKESSFDGWQPFGDPKKVVDQPAVESSTEYKTATGVSNDVKAAAWFKQDSFDGWTQFGDPKTVVDQKEEAPFTEYRTASGAASVDATKVAWFRESSFGGWTVLGKPRKVVDTNAAPQTTRYLTQGSDGRLGESTVKAAASWINLSATTVNRTVWTQMGDQRAVIDTKYTAPSTQYRDVNGQPTLQADKAAWFREASFAGWKRFGDPKTVVDVADIPGYTEYYVQGSKPIRTLGESNWTTESPKGWKLVDTKHVVVKSAGTPVVSTQVVVDQVAWDETIWVPATGTACPTSTPTTSWPTPTTEEPPRTSLVIITETVTTQSTTDTPTIDTTPTPTSSTSPTTSAKPVAPAGNSDSWAFSALILAAIVLLVVAGAVAVVAYMSRHRGERMH